jgi:hypothetical protein
MLVRPRRCRIHHQILLYAQMPRFVTACRTGMGSAICRGGKRREAGHRWPGRVEKLPGGVQSRHLLPLIIACRSERPRPRSHSSRSLKAANAWMSHDRWRRAVQEALRRPSPARSQASQALAVDTIGCGRSAKSGASSDPFVLEGFIAGSFG